MHELSVKSVGVPSEKHVASADIHEICDARVPH